MTQTPRPSVPDEAPLSVAGEAPADIRAWQEQRVEERLKAADEGRFASAEEVRAVIGKYIRNG